MTFAIERLHPFGTYGVVLTVKGWPPSACGPPQVYVGPDPAGTFESRVRAVSRRLIEEAEDFQQKADAERSKFLREKGREEIQ